MQTETITITVDGKQIECRPGELLIAAAERGGVFIPRFCWHPRMEPVGACRMCYVDIEGGPPIPGTTTRRPQTACTSTVRDGMVVHTQHTSDVVAANQKGILEFLLINHPLDCPICDRGGECPLQDQTLDYGPSESRFIEPKRRFRKPIAISPLINLDRERCILCYRCTRFSDEVSGDKLISAVQRGPRAYIAPFEGGEFDSYFSGNTVQICPVGALTSKEYRFEARPWDLKVTPTTCNLCASGCSMSADVRVADGRFVRATALTDEGANEEWLCDKGRYGHAWVSSPERIDTPRLRKDGFLNAISWDEALRLVAEKLKASKTGAMVVGQSLTDEDAYTAQKFARLVLGTNSVDSRLEGGMSVDALIPPQVGYDDLLGSDLVVLVGIDAREELPLVYLRLRVAAEHKGLPIALVHPRRVALSEFASLHLRPLPGQEASAASDAALTSALQGASNAVILLGPRLAGDHAAVAAYASLAAQAGAKFGWAPRRSGEYGALAAGAHPGLLPGWRRVDDDAARAEIEAAWGASLPTAEGEDLLTMLRRAATGGADVLWTVGADLVADVPEAALGAAALSNAGFTIVSEVALTSTALHADLVLPAAAFAEREGTITGWDGTRRLTRAAVGPPGSARADYAIIAEAARRAGKPIGCRTISEIRAEFEPLLPTGAQPSIGSVDLAPQVTSEGFPLRLLSYRLLYDAGTRASQTTGIRELTSEAFVEINPVDAASAGITDGESVTVTSANGAVAVAARVTADIAQGAMFMPYRQPGASAQELMTLEDRTPQVRVEPA